MLGKTEHWRPVVACGSSQRGYPREASFASKNEATSDFCRIPAPDFTYLLPLFRKGTAFSLVILVTPCMYGTNTSGIVTEPSAFW